MIASDHPRLSVARQCRLLGLSRSAFYYRARGENPLNLELLRLIDEQFMETPWYGRRQMTRHLRRQGHEVGDKRVRRLMRRMGLCLFWTGLSKGHSARLSWASLSLKTRTTSLSLLC